MSSRFPYRGPDKAASFALSYFPRSRSDPDIRRTWLGLRSLIQVQITKPDMMEHAL